MTTSAQKAKAGAAVKPDTPTIPAPTTPETDTVEVAAATPASNPTGAVVVPPGDTDPTRPADQGSGHTSGNGRSSDVSDDDTIAAIVSRVLSDVRFVDGINSMIADAASTALAKDSASVTSQIDKHLNDNLPTLVAAAMPAPAAEAASPPAPIVDDTSIATARTEHERKRVEARDEAQAEARERFEDLFDDDDPSADDLDLSRIASAVLRLDNGTAFSIDFVSAVPVEALSHDDRHDVVLKHPALTLGEGMSEQFPVKGLVLITEGADGTVALRCELAHPLLIGGGMLAKIGEDSLIFRRRR